MPADDRVDASMRLVVGEMEQARRDGIAVQSRLDATTRNGDRDLTSALHTPAFLDRWVSASRTMTAGPLPVALLLVTVPGLSDVTRYGSRSERETVTGVAAALTRSLRAVDRAVRLSDNEFLLVVPGVGEAEAADLARQVGADLERVGEAYPFVPLAAISAVTVTRQRPLPLDELRKTVEWAAAENLTIALLTSS
jgi:GGDEF domain-containing protein